LAEGKAEGESKRELEIARNLLAKGSAAEFVQEITGLSLEEIEKL
jgi:predicted transposase YdaD